MPHWTKVLIHPPYDKRGENHTFEQVRTFHTGWKDLKSGAALSESDALTRLDAGETGISRPWKECGFHWAIAAPNDVVEVIMLRPMTQNGAHARENNLNKCAIGVFCENFTPEYLDRLLVLCRYLMKAYKIPVEGIVGRWEVNSRKYPPYDFEIAEFREKVRASTLSPQTP